MTPVAEDTFRLRAARPSDREQVLEWRNLPEIVVLGAEQREVHPDVHATWFAETIASPRRLLLIVEVAGEPAGTVRFDLLAPATWCVSIYLLERFIGRGIGTAALREAWEFLRERGAARVWAFVRDDNARSLAAFRKAGYEPAADPAIDVPPAHQALRFEPTGTDG